MMQCMTDSGLPAEGSVAWWMDRRRNELDMLWDEVAEAAGVSYQTLLNLRERANARSRTKHKVERALGWEPGSIDAITAGHNPTTTRPEAEIEPDLSDEYEAFVWSRPHLTLEHKRELTSAYRTQRDRHSVPSHGRQSSD